MSEKKLYRSEQNRVIGGVCGGIGEYLDTDPTIIRLITAFLILMMGSGIILYILAWLIIPKQFYIIK